MVIFFLVGVEIKREVLGGELSWSAAVALPALSAIGGMAVPAGIFLLLNAGDTTASRGWAIPAATDIAVALSLLALFGHRVPRGLVVFLTKLAVFDDLGTLLIIAVFYSEALGGLAIGMAALGTGSLIVLNRPGVRRLAPYVLRGTFVWVAVLKSGVHATLAGVLIAWCIPAAIIPRVEGDLRPWVSLGVIPIFAFFNAGITCSGLRPTALLEPPISRDRARAVPRQVGRGKTHGVVALGPAAAGNDLVAALRHRHSHRGRLHHEPFRRGACL